MDDLLVTVENEEHVGGRVPVDNIRYVRCSFRDVVFVFSGGAHRFVDCRFEGFCGMQLLGPALETRRFLDFYAAVLGRGAGSGPGESSPPRPAD